MATASLRLTGNVIFNNATGNARMQMEQIGFPAAVIATGRIDAARLPLEPSITGNLTPTSNVLYSLGNATHRWKDLYLAGNTLYLGNAIISESSGGGGGISINAGAGSGSVALGPTRVLGNLVVEGNLTVLGGNVVEIQTETQITDQLIVTNAGTGPALIVEQTGAQDIATFKDDGNVVVRIHDGGTVSIGGDVAVPLGALHVQGNVYASGTYVGNGAGLTALNASEITTGTQVRIGEGAGLTGQGSSSVAIGVNAGANVQAMSAVAVGDRAGSNTQGSLAVAVGSLAGRTSQGTRTVAIGHYAGEISQQPYAVAVGQGAGYSNQGSNAIAIGSVAAQANQAANCIVINATGTVLNNTTTGTCVIKPVRDYASSARRVALYDATSGEVSTNSGHLTMDASNNVLVGTTIVSATGSSLQVGGFGQQTITAFNAAGNMGGSIVLKTTDGGVYSGGAVVFGVPQGNFAAIKGGLTNGGGNSVGFLAFATRNSGTDATLTTKLTITDTNVNIPGNLSFNNQVSKNVISLYGSTDPTSTLYFGFGIESGTLRYNVSDGNQVHRWYHGPTLSMTLGYGAFDQPYLELGGGGGTSPTMIFRDFDHRSGYIHTNANIMHILTGPVNAGSSAWAQVANGRWPLLINLSNNNAEFGGDVRYVSAGVYSDRRIKKDFRDLDDEESLRTLRTIEPVAYKYIDAAGRGLDANVETIGFVAQQIESVLPHAVSTSKGVVPSVYAYGTTDAEDQTIVHLDADEVPFDVGDLVVVHTSEASSCHVRCVAKHTVRSFQYAHITEPGSVEGPISSATPEQMPGPGEPIFVYGHEVLDFKSIKKDVVFTVALAATQELDRQLQAAKAETASLRAETESLRAETEAETESLRAETEAETESLRAEIEYMKASFESRPAALQEADREIQRLKAETESLRAEIEYMKASFEARLAALEGAV